MKKLVIFILLALILGGCNQVDTNSSIIADQESRISDLKSKIKDLEKEKENLDLVVMDIKKEKGLVKYYITIEIKQKHLPLDFENNWKDELNAIEIEIPVNEEFYNSVEKGTILNDDFRSGSFFMSGSIGKWDISVVDKNIK